MVSKPDDDGRRLSVRFLAVALVVQAALFGGLIVLTLQGFPFLGGGDGDEHDRAASSAAAAPAGLTVPLARTTRFDETAAMRIVRRQLSYGQRPAGSPQLRRLADRLVTLLPRGRFEDVPGHPGLRNVVGSLPGRGPVIVLGAHYDTETHPKGFIGANDSAAGTAIVLQVARTLRRIARPAGAPEIRFVLFDGEEEPAPTQDFYRDALRGSKAYVQEHAEEVGAMLLLDYTGNQGLRLPKEGTSTSSLWNRVRAAARKTGVGAVFPDETEASILDDHTPFLRAGIAAVDFIDWSYRYRDTVRDTIDKLSPRSLDAVGETVVELLRTWR